MKAAMIAGLLWVFLAPVGAPAGFTVDGAEVEVHRKGDSAEVRIAYDVTVNNTACGWFQAEFEGLPEGDRAPKATLILDGKEYATVADGTEYATVAEGASGDRSFRAFREEKEEGRHLLDGAKSIRLRLEFPAWACAGPEVTVPVPFPRSYVHSADAKDAAKKGFPRLAVKFDAEVEGASAEVKATFKAVPAGAKVLLRFDARSAGASILP